MSGAGTNKIPVVHGQQLQPYHQLFSYIHQHSNISFPCFDSPLKRFRIKRFTNFSRYTKQYYPHFVFILLFFFTYIFLFEFYFPLKKNGKYFVQTYDKKSFKENR